MCLLMTEYIFLRGQGMAGDVHMDGVNLSRAVVLKHILLCRWNIASTCLTFCLLFLVSANLPAII